MTTQKEYFAAIKHNEQTLQAIKDMRQELELRAIAWAEKFDFTVNTKTSDMISFNLTGRYPGPNGFGPKLVIEFDEVREEIATSLFCSVELGGVLTYQFIKFENSELGDNLKNMAILYQKLSDSFSQ